MNLSKIFNLGGYSAAALIIATFIYASTDISIQQANSTTEFDKLLKENKLVVVQFFSPTCPVCMAFKRKGIFPKAAKALPHIAFAMTSSEQGANLHHEYKIAVFPTFVFFKDGKEVGRYKGYVETPQFIRKVSGIFSAAELKEPTTSSEPATSNQE
jgi:thiol-disulfide isomerase/thioredoxin